MLSHISAKAAAVAGRRAALFRKRLISAIGVAALGLLMASCMTQPTPYAGPDPSDPKIPVPAVRYRSPIARHTSQRPVEPAPWREQNERVAPAPRQ